MYHFVHVLFLCNYLKYLFIIYKFYKLLSIYIEILSYFIIKYYYINCINNTIYDTYIKN